MKLADKLVRLRKNFGWSQEELAEKVNVSRQSVSKWESAMSIPDLNKILKMAEIFGVSTDYLLKDEIEEFELSGETSEDGLAVIALSDAIDYVQTSYNKSKSTIVALFFFFTSVIPLFLLIGLKEGTVIGISESAVYSIGIGMLFILVAIGVVLTIRVEHTYVLNALIESQYFELEYGADSIILEKMTAYKKKYMQNVSIALVLIMTSPLPLVISAFMNASSMMIMFMLTLLFVLVYLALIVLVPSTVAFESYKKLLHEGEYAMDKIEDKKKITQFSTFYWTLVTAVYIGWSLWTMAWGITWIIWPVAGLVFAALLGLLGFLRNS